MAGSLLALLDDVTAMLDDVSVMTKVAAKKTVGLLGDDLALNAQQVTGVRPNRELPIVWAVTKGSLVNKLILVPAALLISVVAPWLITPLLMVGGTYLCFEGAEKVIEKLFHKEDKAAKREARKELQSKTKEERLALEDKKIKGAIRTDFILSAEIVTISLGSVATAAFAMQAVVMSIIAIAVTFGVYGLVGLIVKLDDFGLYLTEQSGSFSQKVGKGILVAAPWFMKTLSVVGTIAMFLVGGGIICHGVPFLHHLITDMSNATHEIPGVSAIIQPLIPMLTNFGVGILVGLILVGIVTGIKKLKGA